MSEQRILVVDDQRNWREVMESLLTDSGYTVDTAGSASQAWKLVNANAYDLIIVDVRLVDSNPFDIQGVELVERISSQLSRSSPVVVMTGYSFEGLKETMEARFGVKAFIRKGTGVFQDLHTFRALIASILDSQN